MTARSRYRRRQPPLHKRRAVRRADRDYYLNYKPRKGLYCVGEEDGRSDSFTPLVCHELFQDALEDENIPPDQGRTTRSGAKRNVKCRGDLVTGERTFKHRRDLRPIYQVSVCRNMTRKQVWKGANVGWAEETEDNLAGLLPRSNTGRVLLGGIAVAALLAFLDISAWG